MLVNVYNGTELKNALNQVIATGTDTTIIFHETEFGFEDEDIVIDITVDENGFHAVANSVDWNNKAFNTESKWSFSEWCLAVCGW